MEVNIDIKLEDLAYLDEEQFWQFWKLYGVIILNRNRRKQEIKEKTTLEIESCINRI